MRRRFVFEVSIEYCTEDFIIVDDDPSHDRSEEEANDLLFGIQEVDALDAMRDRHIDESATHVRTEVEY